MLAHKTGPLWIVLLLLVAFAAPVVGQADGGVLEMGTPLSGTLDAATPAQAFRFASTAGNELAVYVTSESAAVLGLIITDDAGEVLGVDTGTDDVVQVSPLVVAADGTVGVTVFNAGPALIAEAAFEVTVELLNPPTPEPTTAPDVTTPIVATPAESTQVVLNQGISVVLSWASTDDFDLEVRDPVGGSLYWETDTVPSGGRMSPNANQQCIAPVENVSETATWLAGGVPTGSYEVLIYFQTSCNDEAPADFSVDISVDGAPLPTIEGTIAPGDVYSLAFEIAADGSARLATTGDIVNINDVPAPASEILAESQPIAVGETVTGVLTNASFFDAYTFEAEAAVLYTITLEAQSGSLDTQVQVLDDQGRLVRVNDDREVGVTDSSLDGILLPSAGVYTIVATRYAKGEGGTEGAYTLSLTEAESGLPADFAENLTPGALQMLVVWNTPADLQLLVRDPGGDAIFDDVPQVASGGRMGAQGNVQCRVSEGAPYSYIYWPVETQPRAGSYEIEVWYQNPCGTPQPTTFNLYVLYQGQQVFGTTEQILPDERFLTSFTVNADGSASPSAAGIIRGVQDIAYQSEVDNATLLAVGQSATGSISPDNKFDLYAIEGTAGDVINVAMNTVQGSLDPTMYVLGPAGELIASNDDAVAGENTNSLIANLALPADGRYIIIATHFGGPYGGTTGSYQLTFTQLN